MCGTAEHRFDLARGVNTACFSAISAKYRREFVALS